MSSRAYFAAAGSRRLFEMDGVDALVRETDDPEVVVAEIEHRGRSLSPGRRTGSGRSASSGSAMVRSCRTRTTWTRSPPPRCSAS
jgi:hypothetical protein